MESKPHKYDPEFSPKVSKKRAAAVREMFGIEIDGMTILQAQAMLRDIVDCSLGLAVLPASEQQKKVLERFGSLCPPSRRQASAELKAIFSSLNFEVVAIENLAPGVQVIHVNDRNKVLEMGPLDKKGNATFRCGATSCTPRMLRRHRPDGDYSNTGIPEHYFKNGWLNPVA